MNAIIQRRILFFLAGINLIIIILLTQYPFDYYQLGRWDNFYHYFQGLTFGGYTRCCKYLAVLEPLANVLFFLPLGFCLFGILQERVRRFYPTVIFTLCLSLMLSFGIEFMQVFQPERTPSATDLLMNTIGGGLGGIMFHIIGQPIMRLTGKWIPSRYSG